MIKLILVVLTTLIAAIQDKVALAGPSPLEMCIFMAEASVSDLQIPSEVIQLERKLWIVNEQHRWRSSLTQLLASRDKNTRIPDPAASSQSKRFLDMSKSFDKVIMKFIKDTAKRFKVEGCGEELTKALVPTSANYQQLIGDKHLDLDYVVGLADMCVRWVAEQITLIKS